MIIAGSLLAQCLLFVLGVIWPLIYAGMGIGTGIAMALDLSEAHVLLLMMAIGAAVEAPVLKNPLGVAMIVFETLNTQVEIGIGSLLPPIVIACVTSWAFLDQFHYFPPEKQQIASGHARRVAYAELFEEHAQQIAYLDSIQPSPVSEEFAEDLSEPLSSDGSQLIELRGHQARAHTHHAGATF